MQNKTLTLAEQFQSEIKRLEANLLVLWCVMVACGALSLLWVFHLESIFVPGILTLLWYPYLHAQIKKMRALIEHRKEVVAFALCERDLFVCSTHPNDTEVLHRARYALAMLKESGNRYMVKVYYAIYSDACWFAIWNEGKKEKVKSYPQDMASYLEPFPQFVARFEAFRREREFERIQWIRSKNNNWADENLFFQEVDENGYIPFEEI